MNRLEHYVVASLAKGGVVKVFDRQNSQLLLNDCGILVRLEDDRIVTSQWIDPEYQCEANEQGWEVSGYLHEVPSNKLFTLLKNILFRGTLVALGWSSTFSHLLKGQIRKALILGQRPVPVRFHRRFQLDGPRLTLTDELRIEGDVQFATLSAGDEFFVRYVPQSRYFQRQELNTSGLNVDPRALTKLGQTRQLTLITEVRQNQVNRRITYA